MVKKVDYTKLYFDKEVNFEMRDKTRGFLGRDSANIQIRQVGLNIPDCKINFYRENLWLRTRYGVGKKPYSSEKSLMLAVERELQKQVGAYNFEWVESNI